MQRIETTGIVVQDEESESGAIYTPASPEKLQPGLSHQVGRAAGEAEGEEEERGRKKIKTTRWKRRSSGPAGEAQAAISWVSLWILGSFTLPALSKPSRGARILKSQQMQKRGNGVGWGNPAGTRATQLNDIYPHKQKSVPARMRDLACVWPRSSGLHRAGLPDVSYYPAALT